MQVLRWIPATVVERDGAGAMVEGRFCVFVRLDLAHCSLLSLFKKNMQNSSYHCSYYVYRSSYFEVGKPY